MTTTDPAVELVLSLVNAPGSPALHELSPQEAREAYANLFDMLGTSDRRLHANLGGHPEIPEDEYADSRRFLARRLRGGR